MTEEDIQTVPESELPDDVQIIPTFLIPECCREGWPDCPHVINKPQEPERRNIAL